MSAHRRTMTRPSPIRSWSCTPRPGNNRDETRGAYRSHHRGHDARLIVAYPDHLRLSLPVLEELATIPALVARKWCVDEARIYLTGQSDGGMAADAIAFLAKTRGTAAAIAPSAAGVNAKDLAENSCPEPLPVMVMHSRNDTVFPGYGAEAARWWAACNRCDSHPGPQRRPRLRGLSQLCQRRPDPFTAKAAASTRTGRP